MAQAAVKNDQIRWIAGDEDVNAFYKSILPKAVHLYDKQLQDNLSEAFMLEPGELILF